MKKVVYSIIVVGLALAFLLGVVGGFGCGKQNAPKPATTNASTVGQNPLLAPVDYLGTMVQAQKLAVKTTDLASVNKAIQMFSATEGRLPKDLDELVTQKYIGRLPEVPAGMAFVYDPKSGQVSLKPVAKQP